MSITIGISIGDPNGIGPEVVLKTFSDAKHLSICTPIIYAHVDFVLQQADYFNLQLPIERLYGQPKHGVLNVVDCWSEPIQPHYGTVDSKAGAFALKSLRVASKALQQGTIDALVTAPIHKAAIQSEAFNFLGHTDFLAQEFDGQALMFLVHADLRVALVTDHVPIKDIVTHITADRIESKLKAEQEAQQMEFVLQREKKEAERKRIEAEGERDAQNILREGITEGNIKWKSLEVLKEISTSSNAKLIITDGSSPVLINGDE